MAEEQLKEDETIPPPIGTLFVLTIYLAIIAGTWGVMLWGLVGR